MVLEDIQGRVFEPVGVCIYCGSSGGSDGLRTEHIVPFSLGGNAELPSSSCRQCEGVTSYLDGYLARKVFYHFRVHAETQTRRPKERPKKLPAAIVIDGVEEERDLEIPDHPHYTVLPALSEPGVVAGRQPTDPFEWKAHAYYHIPENLHHRLQVEGHRKLEVRSQGELNLGLFARGLIKIGFCHWVATRGLSTIRALATPDIILGKYPYPAYFFGSEPGDPPPPAPSNSLHQIVLGIETFGALRLIVATIRLFGNSGTENEGFPIYRAVIGAPSKRFDQ